VRGKDGFTGKGARTLEGSRQVDHVVYQPVRHNVRAREPAPLSRRGGKRRLYPKGFQRGGRIKEGVLIEQAIVQNAVLLQ